MPRFALLGGISPLFVICLFAVLPTVVDRGINKTLPESTLAAIEPATNSFHRSMFVADLHADPLLWNRDLTAESQHGHVDIPRLLSGGVTLQVFAAPTQIPASLGRSAAQRYDENELNYDVFTPLVIAQRWPARTWQSPLERALYMAQLLKDASQRDPDRFRIIESRDELDDLVTHHQSSGTAVGGLLAIEGLHALEGQIEAIDLLYEAGYRMMGPMHFFDNRLGGSAHGMSKEGLTDFGRQVVKRLEERHIVLDLAHASPKMIDDALDMAMAPVVVSHTGVKGTCDNIRNLHDDHVRRIAATGGVVGIGYWDAAICDVSVNGIVAAIGYVIDLVGADHVGLGSDFDGATTTPFDTSGIPLITKGLIEAGYSDEVIAKVLGGNVYRVLHSVLEARPPTKELPS